MVSPLRPTGGTDNDALAFLPPRPRGRQLSTEIEWRAQHGPAFGFGQRCPKEIGNGGAEIDADVSEVSTVATICYSCRMPDDDVQAELERLRAENAQLKHTASRGVTLKVSEKGGVSVYGLGRFPVTLYKEQWTKLLDMADDIRAFIRANETSLKTKS